MASFDAGSIESRLTVNRDEFNKALDQARADADKFAAREIRAKITADGTQAKAVIDDLTARADKLSGKAAGLKVTADAAQASAEMDKTSAKADALGRKEPVVKVRADTAAADPALDKTAAKADALGRKDPVVKATADTAQADTALDRTAQKRDSLGRFVSVKVKADTAGANADMDRTAAKAGALGRRTETVRVRADTSGIDAATAKVAKLAGTLKDAGGPWWLGPALLGLGAIGTTAGVVTGAAIGLAGAFTAGAGALAAFGAVAKPVLSGAETAQKAVTAAQSAYHATLAAGVPVAAAQQALTVANAKAQSAYAIAIAGGAKPATALLTLHKSLATSQAAYSAATNQGTLSAKAYTTEQAAITKAYAGMSPAQVALSRQLGDMAAGWKNLKTAETPVVAGALVPWLQSVTSLTGRLAPVINAVAPVIGGLGTQFNDLVTSQAFTSFRDFISGTGTATVSAAGSTLIDLVESFIILLPQFDPLIRDAVNHIADLGPAVLKWSQSGQASADIQKFMQWFNANGPSVGAFLKSIGGALKALAPGLTAGGAIELKILTDFLNLVARLPPAFAKPIAAVAGALLLLNKLGIISVGVKVVGAAAGWVKQLLGGATVDVGATAMQAAGDTMVTAAAAMQRAADTMIGADAGAGAGGAAKGAAADASSAEGTAIGASLGSRLLAAGIVAAIALAIVEIGVKPLLKAKSSGTQQDSSTPGNWWDNPGGSNPVDPRTAGQGFSTWAGAGTMIKDWLGFGQSTPSPGATPARGGAATAPGPWAQLPSPNVGEMAWVKWWQDFDQEFVHPVTDWFTVSLPHLFTSTIPHAADSSWNTLWANTITRTARGFHDIAGWFDAGRHDIAAKTGQIGTEIEDGFKGAWNWVVSNVGAPMDVFFTRTLPGWWDTSIRYLRADFVNPFESALKNAWNWVTTSVWSPMGTFFTRTLPGWFTASVGAVGRAWDAIERTVRAPVDWVVQHVYDDLIVKFWNQVAGPVGLKPLIALAEGGIVPGGVSRADNQLVWMRSGEGVLQPGAVAALGGPGFINWANRAYGDVPTSASGAGHYAGGGILPNPITAIGHAVSSVIGDVGGFLGGLVNDVKAGIYTGLAAAGTTVIGAAAKQVPGSTGVADAMRAYPVRLWDGFASWVTGHGPGPVATGGGVSLAGLSGSSGYAAFKSVAAKLGWNAAQLAAWVGVEMLEAGFNLTAVNPGSGAYGMAQFINGAGEYAQYGGNSGTYIGQAVAMANYIIQRYGTPDAAYSHELADHWYDNGGWLQPGATMVMNGTGRPEPVLTGEQWDALTSAVAGGSGGATQLAGTLNVMLPEGTSLTSALNELDYRLHAARMQGFLGGG